jgi:hypothetical protein
VGDVGPRTQNQIIKLNHRNPAYAKWAQRRLRLLLKDQFPWVLSIPLTSGLEGSWHVAIEAFQTAYGTRFKDAKLSVDGWIGAKTETVMRFVPPRSHPPGRCLKPIRPPPWPPGKVDWGAYIHTRLAQASELMDDEKPLHEGYAYNCLIGRMRNSRVDDSYISSFDVDAFYRNPLEPDIEYRFLMDTVTKDAKSGEFRTGLRAVIKRFQEVYVPMIQGGTSYAAKRMATDEAACTRGFC